jgi:hypothetical protein
VLAYTGDTGPSPAIADLARGADLFLAEATYAGQWWKAWLATFRAVADQLADWQGIYA